MGLLSASNSIVRYQIEGQLAAPAMETVAKGLTSHQITSMDEEAEDRRVGWTSFGQPYRPDFGGSSFAIGDAFIFSLRIDRKRIPSAVMRQQLAASIDRRLSETKREYLTRAEKNQLKEEVGERLLRRLPAVPSIYDVIWYHGPQRLIFCSTQKAANEELEQLFQQSFNLRLLRLFPFTLADGIVGLSDSQRDLLLGLTPASFQD